jgi:hypothetical protein
MLENGKVNHSTPDKCAVDVRKQGQMRKDRRLKLEAIDFIGIKATTISAKESGELRPKPDFL